MEFKSVSFFEKYKIDSFCDSNGLFLMFQTDPNKRKDLPQVRSLIMNYKNLFIEELFTYAKDSDNDFKNNCSELLKIIEDFDENSKSNIENFYSIYEKIYNEKNIKDYFYYSKFINEDEANEIFNDYLDCLLNKFISDVFSNYKDNDYAIIKVIVEKSLKFEKSFDLLDSFIENKIEECTLKIKDNKFLKNFFIFMCDLPINYLRREVISNDFLFLTKSIIKNNQDLLFFNQIYKKLFFLLNDEENLKAELLISLEDSIFNINNDGKISFSKFEKEVNTLIENYIYYLKNNDERNDLFESSDFDEKLKALLIYLVNGKDYYDDYFDQLDDLNTDSTPGETFNFIVKFLEGRFPKNTWGYFGEIFATKINLNEEIDIFLNKFNRGKEVVKRYSESKSVTYSGLIDLFIENDCYCEPATIDSFIAKTYFLKYFNIFYNEEGHLKFLHILSHYYVTTILNSFNPYLEKIGKKQLYTYRKEFLLDTLKNYPKDWEFGNVTNYQYAKKEFGFIYNNKYGQSISSTYIQKYDLMFKKSFKERSLKGSKFDEIEKISNYKNAINLYNNGKYEEAYEIFLKLNNYEKSSKYCEYCNEKKLEDKYKKAMQLSNEGWLFRAYEIFSSIKEYKDSEEKAKQNYDKYCSKKYDMALKEFDNKNYKEVIDILTPIKDDYSPCLELLNSAISFNNLALYKKAKDLFKNEYYEESLEIFNSIKDYKDSKAFIKKCKEYLKMDLELEKANTFMFEFKQKTFKDFSKINEAIKILEKLSKVNFKNSTELLKTAKYTKKEGSKNEILCVVIILIIIAIIIIAATVH